MLSSLAGDVLDVAAALRLLWNCQRRRERRRPHQSAAAWDNLRYVALLAVMTDITEQPKQACNWEDYQAHAASGRLLQDYTLVRL